MYGFANTLVCAYWDMYGKYTCRYYFFIIYLFSGFDLENVALASMEMVTELGLVVERTCFRGFSIRRNQPAHFEALQKRCAHQRHNNLSDCFADLPFFYW